MRNLLLVVFSVAGLQVSGLPALAQMAQDSTDFTGAIAASCSISKLEENYQLDWRLSGLRKSVAFTISSNQAIANGVAMIQSGQADVIIAGGTETFSDVPIRFSKPMRKKFIASMKDKTPMAKLQRITKGLKLAHLAPEPPAIANFATGEVMGHSSDRLAAKFGVTREAMDKLVAYP